MTRAEAITEISKQIPDCEKCPLIVENCKKQGHYDGCKKQREAIKKAIEALSTDIIRCKDCRKHNQGINEAPYLADRCPLIIHRGYAKGHEFDEQFCVYGCLPEIMTPPTGETDEKEK